MTESQSKLKINSNKLPKWCKALILSLPVIVSFFQIRTIDNDFYFLYATGEYIVKHGIPYTDMLSMHSSMKIVVQQWLSSVIFYYSYSTLGTYGVFALIYIFNILLLFLTYRLLSVISKNEIISVPLTALINILMFDPFMVSRPQIFTYAILLAEVLLLEKYVQTRKIMYLAGIPVLSLLLINLHAAMWPMILVFMLPYLISAVPLNTKIVKHEATGDLMIMLAIFVVSTVVGLLNPYGVENMIYLTKSYGKEGLDAISEMKPTAISMTEGKTYFLFFALAFLIVFFVKKRRFAVRFFLLFAGTMLLGLMQIKGIPYFMLAGVPAFTYFVNDLDVSSLIGKIKPLISKRIKVLLCIFLTCAVIWICEGRYLTTQSINRSTMAHYENLYNITQILKQADEPVVLYSNFNDGQYYEFFGLHPYIDGRAELFLASNNKEYDYFGEYLIMIHGGIYYREFIDKYQFNYLSVSKGMDSHMYQSLIHDEDFEVVYDSDDVVLFVRK